MSPTGRRPLQRWALRWRRAAPPAPDFLRPQRGLHALSWVACAVASAALLASALEARLAWQQRAAAEEARDAAQQRLGRLRATTAVRPAPAVALPRDETRPMLAHPWRAVFQSVEGASVADVRWLAFEHGTDGALRLEGQAADAAGALRAAEALQAVPGWLDVGLSRIERDAEGSGQRFDLRARHMPLQSWHGP